MPTITVVASGNGDSQTRSSASQYKGFCQEGGLEVLERAGFATDGARVAREALQDRRVHPWQGCIGARPYCTPPFS